MTLPDQPTRILLIEDDDTEAELIRLQLGRSDFAEATLERANRVQAGLARLAAEPPDLVLLDLNLPDGNGLENLQRVLAADDGVPVIILTNVDDDRIAEQCVREGAQDYLIKQGIDADLLGRAIRYALARHAGELSLRESEARFALAVAGARDGIWDWNIQHGQMYYSPRWSAMLGGVAVEAEADLELWRSLVVAEDLDGFDRALRLHRQGQTSHLEHEFRMRRADGEVIWVLVRGAAVRDRQGNALRMAGSLTDITDRKATEAMLLHEALHDALTGLPNRNLFLDRLDIALRQHRRDRRRKFAVLFLDLDRFKSVNDSLGHAAGDELLVEFSKRLSQFLRPGDSIARLGGDEFAILLMDIAGLTEATLVAERVHELLTQKFIVADKELMVAASIGIALSDVKYEHPADILRDADLAMYRTKRSHTGSYAVFDNLMHETALRRLELETDMRSAIGRSQLATYYQPIVSLEQMRITGFEALMRWFHPGRGLIAPEEFIPIAEECGEIGRLTWWIMEEACQQVRQWQASHRNFADLSVSVNISTQLFAQSDFADRTIEILERTGLSPNALHLEITEQALLQHEQQTIAELTRLQRHGVKLHLDDFGTGYASLSYLSLFAYDTIKIDRSFISAGGNLPRDHRIIDALISLGRVLEMGVIAEGVETIEQAQRLRELNCAKAQGFWFSKPLPSESALALLLREGELPLQSIRPVSRH